MFGTKHSKKNRFKKTIGPFGPPKIKIYRSYKKFDNEYFSNALREELETLEGDTYGEFEKKNVLNTHAPIKIIMISFNKNVFQKS